MEFSEFKVANYSWWIGGIIGLLIGIIIASNSRMEITTGIYVGVSNGIVWGFLIGKGIDKLSQPAEEAEKRRAEQKQYNQFKQLSHDELIEMEKMYNKSFPGGSVQLESELLDIRFMLQNKYSEEVIRRAYITGNCLYQLSEFKDPALLKILLMKSPQYIPNSEIAGILAVYLIKKYQ